MPSPYSILVYGHDNLLLETRRMVLEKARFEVRTTCDGAEAEELATSKTVDLVLLCHSLPIPDRDVALATLSALRPAVKLLLITTVTEQVPDGPWETVESLAGAEKMIMAARKAIGAN